VLSTRSSVGRQVCLTRCLAKKFSGKPKRQPPKSKVYATFSKQCSIARQTKARFETGQRFFGRKKNVWTVAKNAVDKGLGYAYRDRKAKKRDFRSLWIARINAGAREHGMSYSEFIGKVKEAGIELNRKVLADLAMNHPEAFAAVVKKLK